MKLHTRTSMRFVFTGLIGLLLLLALVLIPGSTSRGQEVTATATEDVPPRPTPLPVETTTSVPTELPPPSSPPTDTPTETALPTETSLPTELPTATDTLLPTETATSLATMTETATVLASPTTAPSPSATLPPTGPVLLLDDTAEIETGWWSFGGMWNRSSTEPAHSGTSIFSDSPGVAYAADSVSTLSLAQPLTLPPIARVQLRYWQRLDIDAGDSGQVQVSTDNVNWTTVASENAVRNLAWSVRTVYLDTYAGQSIWLRFVLSADSDPTTVGDGWWLDDITITASPLPITSLQGLTATQSDDPALWLTEGNWQATTAPVFGGNAAWIAFPQGETAFALTLNMDVSLAAFSQPELHFAHMLDLAAGNDSAQIQLSTDGGQTWFTLTNYTAAHNTNAWAEQALSLLPYLGQTVRVRFLLVTDGDGAQGTGWTVDAIAFQDAPILPPAEPATPTTTVEVASTPTQEAETGWTTYEDTDPLLIYSGGTWQTFEVAAAVGGTLTGSADPGATLTAYFEGTGLRVLYSKGPEGQGFTAQVDSGTVQAADNHNDGYSHNYILAFEGLAPGPHTLTITNGSGAIWIEAVEVQGVLLDTVVLPATPTLDPSWTPYADTDSRLLYLDGTWETFEVAAAFGGTLTASANPGASFRLAFWGTGIKIVYSKGPDGGSFSATLDGTLTQPFDAYYATYVYQNILTFDNLADGFHTLHIANGQGHVRIEGIYLQGTFPAEGITSNGNLSQPLYPAVQALSVADSYSYNFDDAPVPNTMAIEVIDHDLDRIPEDGVPGTHYYVGDSFDYYPASGGVSTVTFISDVALGGVSHTNYYGIASYQITLEVTFDLGTPVRFVDYDFIWGIIWDRIYSSHPVHLKLNLADSNNTPLFEGIICELPTFDATVCNNSANWNRFDPVDNVRYVTVTFETSDPAQDVSAYTYYHALDDFQFEVEIPNVLTREIYDRFNVNVTPPPVQDSAYNFDGHVIVAPDNLPTEALDNDNQFSLRLMGNFIPSSNMVEGDYTFNITNLNPASGARLWIWDDATSPALVFNQWSHNDNPVPAPASTHLVPDTTYHFFLEYYYYAVDNSPLAAQVVLETVGVPLDAQFSSAVLTPPPGSMEATRACVGNVVQVVPLFIERPNEAKDMMSIAQDADSPLLTGSGLILHDGPTINARRTGYIPWGAPVEVDTTPLQGGGTVGPWVEFSQTSGASWIWYRVTKYDSNGDSILDEADPTLHDQWIAVRLSSEEDSVNRTYAYIVGASDTSHPCSSQPKYAGDVIFAYDRELTARYTIAQSYQTYQTDPGQGRVTHDLSAQGILHRDFYYHPGNLTGEEKHTGSALFTSQGIWMGGMPGTTGMPDTSAYLDCIADSDQNTAGWRYCPDTIWASINWREHPGLVAYYTGESTGLYIVYQNSRLSHGMRGVFVGKFDYLFDTSVGITASGLTAYMNANKGEVFNPLGLSQWVNDNLNNTSENKIIHTGDYLVIDPLNETGTEILYHGFVVVGWGPIDDCSVSISKTYDISEFTISRQAGYEVPYVADFSGGPDDRTQVPVPRPFYCTKYEDPVTHITFGGGVHFWYFYTLPASVTVPANEIYTGR